jgi:nucleotide-binding universal stress UspA family protein
MKRFQKILVVAPVERTPETVHWLDHIVRCASPAEVDWRVLVEQPPEVPGGGEDCWSAVADAAPATSELGSHEWPGEFELRTEVLERSSDRDLLGALSEGGYDLVVVPCMPVGFRPLAEKIGRKAPCSVLVLPPGVTTRPEGLQVAVDFSEFSEAALEIGAAFARGLGFREPRAIHSWWLSERSLRAAIPYEEVRAMVKNTADRKVAEFVAEHAPQDLDWVTELIESPLAYSAILDASRQRPNDMLVLAARGKNAIAEALLGSTAAEVIRGVEAPCLVVKRKGAGIGILREMLDMLRAEKPE